jgi:aminopeptidase YwaD
MARAICNIKHFFILFIILLISNIVFAQDSVYARKTICKLTSKRYFGRGYVKDGIGRTASFIEKELIRFKVSPMANTGYRQEFSYPVNTFPNRVELKVNGKKLKPGKDYIVNPASKGIVAKGDLEQKDSISFFNANNRFLVSLQPKLTWAIAKDTIDFTQVVIKDSSMVNQPISFETSIENRYIPDFKTANICGLVKGTTYPDSMILLTAHYDHLGGMGNKTYFPGANDNASGIAFLLDLAHYYAKNPAPYSIGFIFFAGEEAGLVGSSYFTENPLVPLNNIRFLFNVDMVGTGQEGATVVNATLHPKEFAWLQKVNATHHCLPQLNARGKAPNSDHYFFTEKGVPAFFLYTQGGIKAYHDVNDKEQTLPLTAYNNLFKLFLGFNKGLMEK